MTKNEFLSALRERLKGIPEEDLTNSLDYYRESIEDRMEEGITEEEAVAALGTVEEIAAAVMEAVPLQKIIKAKVKPRRSRSPWEILLLVLGAPLWMPLLASLLAVVLSLYLTLWSVVAVLYVSSIACAAGTLAGILCLFLQLFTGNITVGLLLFGCSLICAGVSILFFLLGNLSVKGMILFGKAIVRGIKRCMIGKEKV